MQISELCSKASDPKTRRNRFQRRKLELLELWRDATERRLAAIKASIATLEEQISRDIETSEQN